VTCKDWGNIWLNGRICDVHGADLVEHNFPKDQIEYELWNDAKDWFEKCRTVFETDRAARFDDSGEFDGNAYNKGGWVLLMLRHQIRRGRILRGFEALPRGESRKERGNSGPHQSD